MRPDDANVAGNVHGGTILKMIEEAGVIISTRHCNSQNGVSGAQAWRLRAALPPGGQEGSLVEEPPCPPLLGCEGFGRLQPSHPWAGPLGTRVAWTLLGSGWGARQRLS